MLRYLIMNKEFKPVLEKFQRFSNWHVGLG